MTDDDRVAFAEFMLALGETYGEPISDARMEIYFASLRDLALTDIRRAATLHVRMQKFFPRPSELRDALGGSSNERADLAWTHLLQEVRRVGSHDRWDPQERCLKPAAPTFFDEAARRAAMQLFGGWGALCAKLPGEGPELLGVAKLFKATYQAFDSCAVREGLPPGETGRELSAAEASAALAAVVAFKERAL